jgi:hypothetical protein
MEFIHCLQHPRRNHTLCMDRLTPANYAKKTRALHNCMLHLTTRHRHETSDYSERIKTHSLIGHSTDGAPLLAGAATYSYLLILYPFGFFKIEFHSNNHNLSRN